MHVTMDTTGSIPTIEVLDMHGDVAVLRVRKDGATLTLRMYNTQLSGVAHQINRHLDRRMVRRARSVQSQTAPVGGAVSR